LGSVCSGALLLAEAGLLQGHRATTHWADVPSLQRFADVEVQGDRLHTFDPEDAQASHLFTSAGVTAGIDLALALVEADLGRPLALAVAQRLVMFLRRPGGQAQFSPLLTPSAGRVQRLARLLEWIPAHLADDLSIEALAFQAHMTPRTLCRLFKQEVGMGPGRYVEQVRLEAARNLLLDGQASVATTARLTGFGHPENLRRTFQKRLSVSPSELAERFG
ncbi:MAG TPA: AraC family transcriptional regulator, partial [Pseudomonas sp.]|nr:AraC family transcriptional regulator [Pseudomonas sp.]